jgi:hypothetical protein
MKNLFSLAVIMLYSSNAYAMDTPKQKQAENELIQVAEVKAIANEQSLRIEMVPHETQVRGEVIIRIFLTRKQEKAAEELEEQSETAEESEKNAVLDIQIQQPTYVISPDQEQSIAADNSSHSEGCTCFARCNCQMLFC